MRGRHICTVKMQGQVARVNFLPGRSLAWRIVQEGRPLYHKVLIYGSNNGHLRK